jgi:hypothetical protein
MSRRQVLGTCDCVAMEFVYHMENSRLVRDFSARRGVSLIVDGRTDDNTAGGIGFNHLPRTI